MHAGFWISLLVSLHWGNRQWILWSPNPSEVGLLCWLATRIIKGCWRFFRFFSHFPYLISFTLILFIVIVCCRQWIMMSELRPSLFYACKIFKVYGWWDSMLTNQSCTSVQRSGINIFCPTSQEEIMGNIGGWVCF